MIKNIISKVKDYIIRPVNKISFVVVVFLLQFIPLSEIRQVDTVLDKDVLGEKSLDTDY